MTIEELLEEIKQQVGTLLEVLKKQIEALPDDEKKIRTTPNDGDKFIFLSTGIWKLNYDFRRESFDLVDGIFQPNASIGNYFKSKEDAEMLIKAMKIEQAIRIRRIELNDGWEPDWWDSDEYKYFICTDCFGLTVGSTSISNDLPVFGYYKNGKIAKQIIDEFKDVVLWYLTEYYPNKDKMYVWGD